jgi:hypothetical protein
MSLALLPLAEVLPPPVAGEVCGAGLPAFAEELPAAPAPDDPPPPPPQAATVSTRAAMLAAREARWGKYSMEAVTYFCACCHHDSRALCGV